MRRSYLWLAIVSMILLGLVRIISTYSTFSFTLDERAHLLTGMEWWDRGTYEFEVLHPPLGRIVMALPLYLDGKRLAPEVRAYTCPRSFVDEIRRVDKEVKEGFFKSYCLRKNSSKFLIEGNIYRTLALARGAASLFFVIASLYVFLLGKRWLGEKGGLASLFVFTMTPVVLGVSSLALTDIPFTAMFLMALHAMQCLMENPRWRMALYAGIAVGLAFATKFTALMFVPLGAALLIAFRFWQNRTWPLPPWKYILSAVAVCFFVIWSIYRFSMGTPAQVFPAAETFSHEEGWPAHLMTENILPMPEFFQGIISVAQKSEKGHGSYLFGKLDHQGVWYFFPSQLLLRTPIPIVALFIIGMGLMIRDAWRGRDRTILIPLVLFWLMLAMVLPSRINIGLRHVIHFYAPLAMVAGYAIARFSESGKKWGASGVLSFGAVFVASAMAHPNYYSDYWKLLDPNPECCIDIPDLDFAQDRKRIADFVNKEDIPEIIVCGFNTDLYEDYTKRKIIQKCPHEKPEGWFALALSKRYDRASKLEWIGAYEPVRRLGTSTDIYYFPPEE
ncbi:MAG: glycosyltransferase family 39 protein [Rickettsiales bacterium]